MLENPNFEQDYWSRTAKGIYKIGHNIIRIMKWLAYYDRSFHEKINCFNLRGFFSKFSNEIS